MSNVESNSAENTFKLPEGAISVLIWNIKGRYGYVFLSEPLKKINDHIFEGKQNNSFKILLVNVEFIERKLTLMEKNMDEVLWGIHKYAEFTNTVGGKSHENKYFSYFTYNGRVFSHRSDNLLEVLDENNIKLENDVLLHGSNLQLICFQTKADDSDNFSLDSLPEIQTVNPHP